ARRRLGEVGAVGGGSLGATYPVLPQPPKPPQSALDRCSRAIYHPLLLERCLGRGETGDGHAERRAGDVVHAHVVAELDRRGLAAVLPTDADLQLAPGSPTEPDRQLDELA